MSRRSVQEFHHFVNSLLIGSIFFNPISPFSSWFLPNLVPSAENLFGSVSLENKLPTSGLGGKDGKKNEDSVILCTLLNSPSLSALRPALTSCVLGIFISWAFPQFHGMGTGLLLSFLHWDFFSSTSHLPPLYLLGNLPGLLHCYFHPCGLTIKNFLYCHFYRVWGGRGEKQARLICLIRSHNCWLKKKLHTMREMSCSLWLINLGSSHPISQKLGTFIQILGQSYRISHSFEWPADHVASAMTDPAELESALKFCPA